MAAKFGNMFNGGHKERIPVPHDRGGRPMVYTEAVVSEILQALTSGVSRRVAARYAGVSESTLNDWLRDYPDFAASVEETEARTQIGVVGALMQKARRGDVPAIKFLLERRFHEDWKERTEQDININGGISSEDLDSKLSRIAAEIGANLDTGGAGA